MLTPDKSSGNEKLNKQGYLVWRGDFCCCFDFGYWRLNLGPLLPSDLCPQTFLHFFFYFEWLTKLLKLVLKLAWNLPSSFLGFQSSQNYSLAPPGLAHFYFVYWLYLHHCRWNPGPCAWLGKNSESHCKTLEWVWSHNDDEFCKSLHLLVHKCNSNFTLP